MPAEKASTAKPNSSKQARSNPHKHLQARISYLQCAAKYLASTLPKEPKDHATSASESPSALPDGASRHMTAHARGVSRKAQIRLSQDAKRAICKRCDARLVQGKSSEEHIENLSKNGAKPWADVLVITCLACMATKRYPVGAKRNSKKSDRQLRSEQTVRDPKMPDADQPNTG